MENYREYTGNLHVHSLYSDGSGRHTDIAEAAADAGLDFVIVTDHNLRVEGLEGYYGRVLLLIGQEAHNSRRRPQANHLLIYGANQELAPYTFGSAQTLIQKANECGGICYIAHPVERSSPLGEDFHAIPWIDWPIEGITGLEIWNYMSEFKGLLWSRLAALIYAFLPDWGIRGPYRATLRLWDELLSKGTHLAALGGADAHASRHTMAGITRTIFPYEYLFRCVNTHVLTDGPLTGDETRDRRLIYDALRTGRTWVGYDLPDPTHGFQFFARSGAARRTMGEELKRLGAVTLEVNTPARGEIRLLRDGQLIGKTTGSTLSYTSAEAGIYRVEVYRKFRGMRVGWIFSSPIYIR